MKFLRFGSKVQGLGKWDFALFCCVAILTKKYYTRDLVNHTYIKTTSSSVIQPLRPLPTSLDSLQRIGEIASTKSQWTPASASESDISSVSCVALDLWFCKMLQVLEFRDTKDKGTLFLELGIMGRACGARGRVLTGSVVLSRPRKDKPTLCRFAVRVKGVDSGAYLSSSLKDDTCEA